MAWCCRLKSPGPLFQRGETGSIRYNLCHKSPSSTGACARRSSTARKRDSVLMRVIRAEVGSSASRSCKNLRSANKCRRSGEFIMRIAFQFLKDAGISLESSAVTRTRPVRRSFIRADFCLYSFRNFRFSSVSRRLATLTRRAISSCSSIEDRPMTSSLRMFVFRLAIVEPAARPITWVWSCGC